MCSFTDAVSVHCLASDSRVRWGSACYVTQREWVHAASPAVQVSMGGESHCRSSCPVLAEPVSTAAHSNLSRRRGDGRTSPATSRVGPYCQTGRTPQKPSHRKPRVPSQICAKIKRASPAPIFRPQSASDEKHKRGDFHVAAWAFPNLLVMFQQVRVPSCRAWAVMEYGRPARWRGSGLLLRSYHPIADSHQVVHTATCPLVRHRHGRPVVLLPWAS